MFPKIDVKPVPGVHTVESGAKWRGSFFFEDNSRPLIITPSNNFSGWLCHFKGLFVPVWREIHGSKILSLTSWQVTNRTVSDISGHSRHSVCQSFVSRVNL